MADLFRAYKFLNDSLGLKLSDLQIARAEARFRLKFIEEERDLMLINQERYKVAEQDLQNWEFFSYLAPRRHFSNPELAAAVMKESLEEKKE